MLMPLSQMPLSLFSCGQLYHYRVIMVNGKCQQIFYVSYTLFPANQENSVLSDKCALILCFVITVAKNDIIK